MIDSSKAVYLIDASAFVFRAYYALAPLSSKGRPSHAVVGFASTLLKLLREKKPRSCVVVFDSKKPSFRKEIYSEYKANRIAPPPDLSDQIKAVMEMCRQANLPILQEEGMEADDWIASFVETHKKNFPIVVVSTDKDLTQFVCDNVVLLDAFKDKFIGAKEIEEKWGVQPEQMADLLSLVGDTSDNVPGLSGVGPKTAAAWLKEYKSIDALLAAKDKLPEKISKKILPCLEQLELSRKLIALKNDLKIPFAEVPEYKLPFPKSLREFLVDWDCTRTIATFAEELGYGEATNAAPIVASTAHSKNAELKTLKTSDELKKLIQEIQKAKIFTFDTETSSFDRNKAKLVGLSLATNIKEAWYLPLRHRAPEDKNFELLDEKEVFTQLKKVFEDPKITKVAHNFKYDLQMLWKEDVDVNGPLYDTMIEGHLLHADRRSFSLENLSREFLGKEKGDLKSILQGQEDFSLIPIETATPYAAQDAHLTFELHEIFFKELSQRTELKWLFEEVEMPLVKVLAKMESQGILLNVGVLEKLSREMHSKISKIEKKVYELAGEEFNLASPKQLQTILFTKLGLEGTKKTKTGFSTDESVLQELAEEHELPKLLLEHRALSKLTSTYVDVLPTLVSAADRRLHTHYHQTGTATGRLSSSDPNLQNIPIRSEEGLKIRGAFVPEENFQLLSADYSQVELRLFAHLSEEKNLIKAFNSGRDIHSETAKIIFGSDEKEHRSRAKAINFGIIYGISAFGLSKQLSISRSDAAKFMEAYFTQFPRLKEYMQELVALARKTECTETMFGRRRPLPDISSKNPTLRAMAERIAINAPVQGTAADIMKAAMVRISSRLEGKKSRLLLQVHDELLFEVHSSEEAFMKSMVVEEMMDLSNTPVKKLSVPLAVDAAMGPAWSVL